MILSLLVLGIVLSISIYLLESGTLAAAASCSSKQPCLTLMTLLTGRALFILVVIPRLHQQAQSSKPRNIYLKGIMVLNSRHG